MLSKNIHTPEITATSISNQRIELSGFKGRKVLIKFHRFSGCPVAQWQINEFIARQNELNAAGIATIVFLHSSTQKIKSNFKEVAGLHIIPDKQKVFYKRFESEFSWKSLLSINSWRFTFASFFHGYYPHFNKFEGGIVGIPSDFLLDEQGRIMEQHYGKNFGDSWSVSDVLSKSQIN
jgi:peroxiredoxin